jgi:hypothetical protein
MCAPRSAVWRRTNFVIALLLLNVVVPCFGQTTKPAQSADRPATAQPAAKAAAKPAVKADVEPAVKTDAKPAIKADVKPAAKPELVKKPGFAVASDKDKAPAKTATAPVNKVDQPSKPAVVAQPAVKPVATPKAEPPKDLDLALLGEFAGPVATGPARYQRLALQVRPTGNGGFDAIQYQGGLPGEPTHRPAATLLVGKRWERFLVLSGGPWAIFVEPDHCVLLDHQGQRVGRLERVVRSSPTLGAVAPKDAVVLFDGRSTSLLTSARMTPDGLLMEGADVRPLFQDFNLHLEFLLPYLPAARDQGRGNSGVYLLSRYEIQILDSFAQLPVFNGCGAIYRFRKPDVNMCLPPQTWQTYDIAFTSPRWLSDGTKWKNARLTVWLNGIKVQNNVELTGKTGAGKMEDPLMLPIRFQDHRNPVRFRNIWLVDRGAQTPAGFPVFAKPAAPAKKP